MCCRQDCLSAAILLLAGVDLLSLDGKLAVLCSIGIKDSLPHREVKLFLRTARFVCKVRGHAYQSDFC